MILLLGLSIMIIICAIVVILIVCITKTEKPEKTEKTEKPEKPEHKKSTNWKLVVVGYLTPNNRNILYSEDGGLNWTAGTGSTFNVSSAGRGYDVAYGNNMWVAIGYAYDSANLPENPDYHTSLVWSDDGKEWHNSEGAFYGGFFNPGVVLYANNTWVAAFTEYVLRSLDGKVWEVVSGDMMITPINIYYNNNIWVITGSTVTEGGEEVNKYAATYSVDNGLTWTYINYTNMEQGTSILYANNIWVLAGSSNVNTNNVIYSNSITGPWIEAGVNLFTGSIVVKYHNDLWIVGGG